MIKEQEILKDNLIKLVKDHRRTCNNVSCSISLSLVLVVGKLAGLEFTEEEADLFI